MSMMIMHIIGALATGFPGLPGAPDSPALSRWKHGVRPSGRRVPWPADLRSTAASSTDAVLELV